MLGRSVRTSQPQGPARPVLFGGRPIGNLGLWMPPITTGLTATANGAPNIQPGIGGQSFNVQGTYVFSSSGRGFQTGLIRAPSQLTLGLVFQTFDTPANTAAFGGPFSSDHATINWHHNQADYRGAFTLFVGGAYPKVQFPDTSANKLFSVIGTWNGSVMNLFINGRHIGQASATGLLNGGNAAAVRLLTASGNGGFNGQVYLAHVSDFALPFNQALEVSANPWQIFAPDSKSLWVPETISAGGGATVIPIGVQATGSVGTPSATGAVNATPAGVSTTASVGTPTAAGGSSIAATALPAGVAASSAVGAPTATGAAVAQPVGVSAVSAVGTPVAIAGANIPATALPAGVQAFGAVGTPTVTAAAIAQPLGVAAIAYVGTPTIATGVSGVAVAYPAGVQAIGQVGTLIATGAAWTAAVGVQAVASVGTPSAYAGIQVIYTPGAQTRPSRLQSSSRPSRIQTGTRASR